MAQRWGKRWVPSSHVFIYNLFIKAVQPHILVKGGDYEGKEVVGQEIADELRLVNFVEGKSTT
ncbi:MAG TPA: hypothetical protein EYP29_01185, partial [Thermoplasmata archaeon]|nr:hypothetical protein [Thermoplasmata archaeon]